MPSKLVDTPITVADGQYYCLPRIHLHDGSYG